MVANLGALVARLIFSKAEEVAYNYFNKKIKRGEQIDPKVTKTLGSMLRIMSLFGCVVLAFGFSYSHLLLHLYGGSKFSNGLGHSLLRGRGLPFIKRYAICVYLFLIRWPLSLMQSIAGTYAQCVNLCNRITNCTLGYVMHLAYWQIIAVKIC